MDSVEYKIRADRFEAHFSLAKEQEASGKLAEAKKNYYLAAELLYELAKEDTPNLRKVRFDRAKRIVAHADRLIVSFRPVGGSVSAEGKGTWLPSPVPDVSFDDVVGLDEAKTSIRIRMIYPLLYPEKYQAYGKKSGGGMVLFGPPGTGKTLLARAVAHEANAVFYAVKGSDIMSRWVGESERNIRDLFESARSQERAVIFIDELDALLARRGQDIHNDQRVNEFLQNMDGFAGRAPGLLLLGATNFPWNVDPAALRSGRFSERVYIPLPDYADRRILLQREIGRTVTDGKVDIDRLASLTEGYSCADIVELTDRAMSGPLVDSFGREDNPPVTTAHYLSVLASMQPTVTREEIAKYEAFAGKTDKRGKGDESDGRDGRGGRDGKDGGDGKDGRDGRDEGESDPLWEDPLLPFSPTADDPAAEAVVFAQEEISLMPGESPSIAFTLQGKYRTVSVLVDGEEIGCFFEGTGYASAPFDTDRSEILVSVKGDGEILATKTLRIVRGIREYDFGF
ncbi:MAG: ATP-binding protein [Christensenellaceae bacterium]